MRFEPSSRVPSHFPPEGLSSGLGFVAQSPGTKELQKGTPLVGASGQLLQECCEQVGIPWSQCYKGNVIGFKPPDNDFDYFCGKKADVGGKDYPLPFIKSGQYLRPEWFDELARLKEELERLKPNLVVALGNEALWALTRQSGITKWRGAFMESTLVPGLKVLPTWHPAGILRAWEHRIDLTLDLIKAKGDMGFPEIRQLSREIWIYPEIKDLWEWEKMYASAGALCSVDIETKARKFISCVGFAFGKQHSLVVPFWSDLRPDHSYWRELTDEIEAWEFVAHMLETYPVLGQNYYAFDFWVQLRDVGIYTRNLAEDTMIQHHVHMLELQKKLGYLASIYCNIPAYKTMRPRGDKATKREE